MYTNQLSSAKYYNKFWFHLISNFVLFLILCYVLPVRFNTNDDTYLILISSGAYSGLPDAHLVYMNYIYGMFLKFLYSIVGGGIEWYTICMMAIHIVSLAIITWQILERKARRVWKILGVVILYFLEIQIISQFQYTTTAALCATAALVLYLGGNMKQKYLAAILFTLGTMIRFDPAYLAGLVFAPIIIYFLFQNKKEIIKNIIPLSLFIFLSLGAYFVDRAVYESDPAWKEYKEFNYYRGRVSDNPNSYALDEYPQTMNKSDFILFRSFFPDTQVITNDKAKNTYEFLKDIDLKQKIGNVFKNSMEKIILWIFLLFGVYIAIIHQNRRLQYLTLSTVLLLFFSLSYVMLDAFVWHRVIISAIIPYSMVMIYMCSKLEGRKIIKASSIVLLVLILFLVGSEIRRELRERRANHKINLTTDAVSTINALKEAKGLLKEGEYLVNFASALGLETFSPFSISEYYRENRFVILSWLSKSPFNVGVIDSYQDLVGRNIICMSKWMMDENLFNLKESILENYGIKVRVDILHEEDKNILFRLEAVEE